VNEPFVPRALLVATMPTAEYESILGDLHEEYIERFRRLGRLQADLWYWDQSLRSIPSLLSYTRDQFSPGKRLSTAAIAFGLLCAMLFVKDLFDRFIDAFQPAAGLPIWLYFTLDWLIAAIFGALFARFLHQHPVRLVLLASGFLIAAVAAPILLGLSPQISPPAWLLLLGVIPAMCSGAAFWRAIHKL
jgi:hypothetical protein